MRYVAASLVADTHTDKMTTVSLVQVLRGLWEENELHAD